MPGRTSTEDKQTIYPQKWCLLGGLPSLLPRACPCRQCLGELTPMHPHAYLSPPSSAMLLHLILSLQELTVLDIIAHQKRAPSSSRCLFSSYIWTQKIQCRRWSRARRKYLYALTTRSNCPRSLYGIYVYNIILGHNTFRIIYAVVLQFEFRATSDLHPLFG